MNCSVLRKYYLIFALFSLVSLQMRAEDVSNAVALSFTKALTAGSDNSASTTVGDVTFTFSGDKTTYYSDNVELGNSSKIKVSVGSNTSITGITINIYGAANSQAAISLNNQQGTFKNNVWTGTAGSVEFKNNDSKKTVAIESIVVTYTKSSTLAFTDTKKDFQLYNLFTTSSDNNTLKSGTAKSYTSLNTTVAQIDKNGYLRFVNSGLTTISATDASNNTAYYVVKISAPEVNPAAYIKDNVLDLSNVAEGELSTSTIKLSSLVIGVGSQNETAVLKNLGTADVPRRGIVCLDKNGYNHAEVGNTPPTMGTYFTFKPTASGTLTVKGYFNQNGGSNNNEAVGLYLDGKGNALATITFDASAQKELTYTLEAGNTYYLYVPTTNIKYDYFCPNYISFTSDFKFSTKSYTAKSTETSHSQKVTGGSSVTYTAEVRGENLTANVDNSGNVSWSGNGGGAIIVTAKDTKGSSDFYVITVPYKTHTWKFTSYDNDGYSIAPAWDKMSGVDDWQFYYKVRQYDNGSLTYIQAPYVSNATAFDGINAYYMSETAGLLIKADVQAFGSDVASVNTVPSTNEEKLRQPISNVKSVKKLTLREGTTLTIPNLTAGQYVRLRWQRYAPQTGDLVSVSNLNDLKGSPINKRFRVGTPVGAENNKRGYQEFIVNSNGDVTFTLVQEGATKGYVDIEEISVADNFMPTQFDVSTNASGNTSHTYYYSASSTEKPEVALRAVNCTSSLAPQYTVEKKDGSTDFSFYHSNGANTFTVNAGQGLLTITAEAHTTKDSKIAGGDKQDIGDFVLDKVSTEVTILKYATTTQTYPYTWDFKKYDPSHFSAMTTTSGSTSDLWTADNSENKTQYTLNRNSWDCVSGDELRDANGQAVAEAQGLGFTATRGSSSTLVYRTGDDIKFDGADADILHIPTVPTGATVYMLIKVNNGGTVTVDGNPLSGTDVATTISSDVQGALGIKGQTNWKLYTIAGADKTIDIALANVQLRMVAVTDIFKTFNHLEGMDKSYATEYRDQAERYELSELFTNGASPVTAHIVSAVSDNLATASEVAVAPKYTGVILSTSNQAAPTNVPLFVPDINTPATSLPTNYLKGVLSDSTITPSGANVNYIFTPYYYKVNESGAATMGQQAGTLAFYRQLSGDNTTLGAHKAYLQIPQSASSKQYIFISSIANGDLPSAIRIAQDVLGDDEVYYTLGGQRLQRQPVRSGVYIRNGKKIIVKQK